MGAVSSVVEAVSDTVSDIGNIAVDTVSNIGNLSADALASTIAGASNLMEFGTGGIGDIVGAASDTISAIGSPIVDTAVNVWHDVSEPVVDTQLGRLALNVATGGKAAPILAAYDISQGADPTKALTNAALSYIGSEYISPEISAALGGDAAANIAADALVGGTKSAVQGGDFTSGAVMGGIGSGITEANLAAAEDYLNTIEPGIGYSDAPVDMSIFEDTTVDYNNALDAGFIAADAQQLQQQGLSTAAIQQNLEGAGVDPIVAATASDAVSTGVTGTDLEQAIKDATATPVTTTTTQTTPEPTTTAEPQLIPTQLPQLLKYLGLLGGTAAVGKAVTGLPGLLGGLSFQPTAAQTVTPFTGTYSGMNPYSPEYFQQVQQKYNTLFPSTPADVATPLQAWYNTKFVPDTSISKTLFGV